MGLVLVVCWVGVGLGVASSWCSPGFHWTHLSEFVRGSSLQVGKLDIMSKPWNAQQNIYT